MKSCFGLRFSPFNVAGKASKKGYRRERASRKSKNTALETNGSEHANHRALLCLNGVQFRQPRTESRRKPEKSFGLRAHLAVNDRIIRRNSD